MNKKIILLSMFLLFCSLLIACQVTPEKEAVINKNSEIIENKIEKSGVSSQKVADEKSWKDNYVVNEVKINIDAVIEVPDATAYPIARVKPIGFDENLVKGSIMSLAGEHKLYYFGGDTNQLMTQEIIQTLIIEQKSRIQEIRASGDTRDDIIQNYENTIIDLEKKYEKAPAESDVIREEFVISNIDSKDCSILFDGGKPIPATISILDERDTQNRAVFRYYNFGFDGAYTDTHYQEEQPNGVKISREEALNLCKKTLAQMGIENMDVANISVSNRYFNSGYIEDDTKQCYTFYFSRTFENIPTPLVQLYAWKQMGIEGGVPDNYKNPWTSEYIMIDVDDTGILSIHWQNPIEILEVENNNVEVLTFDEVKEKFKNDMEYVLSNDAYSDMESVINITKVEIGNQFVPIKNSMDEYRLMPCWIFFGNDSWLGEMSYELPTSELLLNAIDGSIL